MIEISEITNAPDGTKEYLVKLPTESERRQFEVLMDALQVYSERNVGYKDNWKRMGWRGQLIRLRERSERLWDALWDAPAQTGSGDGPPFNDHDVDDAIDAINFAAFLVRAVREGNRDGSWWS